MAVPKRKVSRARRDKRRSNVWKLDTSIFRLPTVRRAEDSTQSMRQLRLLQRQRDHQKRLIASFLDWMFLNMKGRGEGLSLPALFFMLQTKRTGGGADGSQNHQR